jgi:rubrerythrin
MQDETREAIDKAVRAEGYAFGLYTIYASKLREKGLMKEAHLFEELANNEREHMEQWLDKLGALEDAKVMLDQGIKGEDSDANQMYQSMMQLEEREVVDLATLLKRVELHHQAMLQNLRDGDKASKRRVWICPHCGNVYDKEKDIPETCPICGHKKGDYEERVVVVELSDPFASFLGKL